MQNLRTDFGAVGDGVADDTLALQRALDAFGEPVFAPSGTYRISSGVQVRSSGCHVEGEDGTVLLYQGPSDPGGAMISFAGYPQQGDFALRKVRMTCATPGSIGYAIASTNPLVTTAALEGVRLERCKFDGFFASVLRAANPIKRASIVDCEMTNNSRFPSSPASAGCITGTLHDSEICGCYIHDTGVHSTLNHAIYLNGGSHNIRVIGNTFDDPGFDAMAFGTSTDGFAGRPHNNGLIFAHNTVRNTRHAALRVACATSVVCASNTVIDGDYCAVIGPCAYAWVVEANVCSSLSPPDAVEAGTCICLAVYGASHGAVRGNTAVYMAGFESFYTAPGWGIMVNGCSDIDITDNTITGYDVGINLAANTQPGASNARIRVRDNLIARPTGAANPRGPWRPYGVTTGIAIGGQSEDVEVAGNAVTNYATGILLAAGQKARGMVLKNNRLRDVTIPLKTEAGVSVEITV